MTDDLDALRRRIDSLDRRLLDALKERAATAREIGRIKSQGDRAAFDPGREREVLRKLLEQNAGTFPPEALEAVFREIISASRALEAPMTVGYLGRPGGFAEFAAGRRFGASCRLAPSTRAGGLFHDLEAGRLDYALVPRDVGDEDAALPSFDLFLDHAVTLFGEYVLRRGYTLAAAPGAGNPRVLYGHPAALARCRDAASTRSGVTLVAVGGSAEAAERAAAEGQGAFVPAHAAAAQGLDVVLENAEDDPSPRHRFLILARGPAARSGRDRTALACVLPNRPRALHRLLDCFAAADLNVAWLEIRESRQRPWEHAFLVEVDGHRDDPAMVAALDAARGVAAHLTVLGSYPLESEPAA